LATYKYCYKCAGGKPNINIGLQRDILIKTTADQELLKLIYDDLKMRADDGVVDISGFIWERLCKRLSNTRMGD